MTDVEKAKELGEKYFPDKLNIFATPNYDAMCCKEACTEMAEYKNEKFYTILACIKYSLEKSGLAEVDKFIDDIQKQWEE